MPKEGKRALRIVLVTHYFSAHLGGVENVAGQIATRIVEQGEFTVTWFASDCDLPPADVSGLLTESMRSWNWLERFGLPWPIWSLGSIFRLQRAIAAANMVHLHDFIYFGSLAAFLLAWWHGKPVLVTQHIGDIPYRSPFLKGTLKLINRTVGKFVLSRASQVVFYSEVVRAQFRRSVRFKTEPLFFQPNGIDAGIFHPLCAAARSSLRESLARHPGKTVCLFVGRFVEKKGLPILHELAREFAEVEWWLLGWGATSAALDPANWRLPNVRVFSGRSGASLAELYCGADLLVLPSKGEGFPLVVQEAMACGTPAMISSATALAVPDALPYLFTCDLDDTANTFVMWRGALRDLLESGDTVKYRKAVADYAHRNWSWETCIDQYRAVFRRLGKGG